MCALKRLYCVALLVLLIQCSVGKKSKKSKRPKPEEEETTSAPSVVTYSSFGFGDAGQTYDGFVPSSPDYASFMSGYSGETSTRLYAPAFPSAADAYNYGQPGSAPEQASAPEAGDPGVFPYPNNPYLQQDFEGQSRHMQQQDENEYAMVYGTKLGKNVKSKPQDANPTGSSQYEGFSSADEKQQGQQNAPPSKGYDQAVSSYFSHNIYNYPPPTYPPEVEKQPKHAQGNGGSTKYQKVLDFTKYKPEYPSELQNRPSATSKPVLPNYPENNFDNGYYNPDGEMSQSHNKYNNEDHDNEQEEDKYSPKPVSTNYLEYSVNHIDSSKNDYKNSKPFSNFKDKFKGKRNASADFNNYKPPTKIYEYFSDYKNTSFRRPVKSYNDEVTSASNNVIDLSNYKYSESDFPDFKQESYEHFPGFNPYKYQESNTPTENEYFNQYKGYNNVPSTSSNWGSAFKTTEFPPFKSRPKRPQANTDDVVHIPKKHKFHIAKNPTAKPSEWSTYTRHGPSRPRPEEPTRFKSEEDLLGLRTHDTSHPSYLPSYKYSTDGTETIEKYVSDKDYKNLVEKWRQSYLKSKYYKDFVGSQRDAEAYGSEPQPMHVPVPKPYPIEVPRPVIVPVPQPYPVRVPIPKPVAVPVVRELTIPIEKPVPYPVIKKVPYPIEKPVPVTVEKEVQVAVYKPYAVPVPHVRPVFHHSRHAADEEREPPAFDDDRYYPRPAESAPRGRKLVKYLKKSSSRHRSRRPSGGALRTRRRWPARRPGARRDLARSRRPRPSLDPDYAYAPRFRYHEYETEDYDEHDRGDYYNKKIIIRH